MRPAAMLAAYGLALAAAVGAGAAAGAVIGPVDTGATPRHETVHEGDHGAEHTEAASPGGAAGSPVSAAGFTLAPTSRLIDQGNPFSFRILGPSGHPVTAFAVRHDKRLHLIVASTDLHTFAHVHPSMAADGTWTVSLPDLPPGAYRAFADMQPAGADPLTLGVDLFAPGAAPAPTALVPTSEVTVDGYRVTIAGDLQPNLTGELTVTVARDGVRVQPDPYLGARGHLVALRDGDLAYLHVHPVAGAGVDVRFEVEVPSAGTYALFFDFAAGGSVHTAPFVVVVGTPHTH